jgi:hypothetical protein
VVGLSVQVLEVSVRRLVLPALELVLRARA